MRLSTRLRIKEDSSFCEQKEAKKTLFVLDRAGVAGTGFFLRHAGAGRHPCLNHQLVLFKKSPGCAELKNEVQHQAKVVAWEKLMIKPAYAHEQTWSRRLSGSKLSRDNKLHEMVLRCLARGWAPQAIAGWLRQQKAAKTVSYETIYKFIYEPYRRTQNSSWQHYLPKAKFKCGWRGRKGGGPARFIKPRAAITDRPKTAENRQNAGYWEADLMGFSNRAHLILVLHDRKSRVTFFKILKHKTAAVTVNQLAACMQQMPPPCAKP